MELLERAGPLALLDERLESVRRTGRGRLVLVAGEAGVGKTALVRAFCGRHPRVSVLSGACEALFTPRPLGPFVDIATEAGGELESLVDSDPSPAQMLAALSRELRGPRIVVLEDLHWADEATLDVLRLLGRRVAGMPALVVATYRDSELETLHPLRIVLGELSSGASDRLAVKPLSPEAVNELAAGRGVDGSGLHAQTGGNAFFVTEVLAAGGSRDVPDTVRDAVIARAASLDEGARRVLEAVAVVPPHAELWLLERLAGPDFPALDACLASGMLRTERDIVGFRHEIARVTIEAELAPDRRLALHRAALAALVERGDPARLAHHAEAAQDGEAVLKYATAAGERAARLRSHREAAEQFARALRHAGALEPAERAAMLGRRAHECYLTLGFAEATEAYELAREEYRAISDLGGVGESERWLSRLAWMLGDNVTAEEHALEAVKLLESLPEGRELAMAYSNVAQLRMLESDSGGAVAWGARAIELAERLGETEVLAHALNNVGTAELESGNAAGGDKLGRSLTLALSANLEDHAGRAYVNLATGSMSVRDYATADRYLDPGIAYAREHDLDTYRVYLLGWKARRELEAGRWDAAAELAATVLEHGGAAETDRMTPLLVIGRLRARRADGDPWGLLDEALEIARPTGELQRLAPVACARAEARWLAGQNDRVAEETGLVFDQALERNAWAAGELAVWRHRGGLEPPVQPESLAAPFRVEFDDPAEAARLWTELGCPYEAALALAGTGDEDDLRTSLAELQRLGARATARVVARRLREQGARNVRRGPHSATRGNPAGLTERQMEVLALLAQGERNADIAARLFLSQKTVSHHVSAILTKLGVRTRGQAGAEALRLGIGQK
jgi:DNA-binding CsgD family transcriptional regulator/tetratricopeptide (TPR) repeat protein